jgi:hypothetical protein
VVTLQAIVDVTHSPEVRRLAEEVRATNTPRLLRRDGEDIAVIVPLRRRPSRRAKTAADYEAFCAAAGGWKNVDTDAFLRDNYASRAILHRKP